MGYAILLLYYCVFTYDISYYNIMFIKFIVYIILYDKIMSSIYSACSVGTPNLTKSATLVMEVLLDTCSIVEFEIPVQISIPAMRVAARQVDFSHTLYRYRTISSFILLRMSG